jgi:hypothetical protein
MPEKLKRILRAHQYRQEATIIGLGLIALLSLLATLIMCFFSPHKAAILFVITLVLFALFLFYRTHYHVHFRASVLAMRQARIGHKRYYLKKRKK